MPPLLPPPTRGEVAPSPLFPMVSHLPTFVVRHAWAVLVVTVIVAVAAASGITRLSFTANYRVFFTPDDPQLRAFDELQAEYTPSDNCLFCIAPTTATFSLATP